jgi:lysophospholipase
VNCPPAIDYSPPPGAIWSDIRAADGVRLRAARWAPQPASRGTVVVLGGRSEFIEKYYEVVEELLSRGFAVAAMDWRGQGGSARPLQDARKGHVGDFRQYERDLEALVREILAPHCPRPWFGLCHSMGAAIVLGAAADGHSYFERLVLTSPMLAVKGVSHRGSRRMLVEILNGAGLGRVFVPGGRRPSLWLSGFEGNIFTSDRGRYARVSRLVGAHPELALGGPTIGWTYAAFRHMTRLESVEASRRITTPVLIVAAGADQITDTAAVERFAQRLVAGRIVVLDGAEHEILIERDELRAQFWSEFDRFIPARAEGSPSP